MDSSGCIRDAHGDGGGHNVTALHSQLLAVEAMRIGEHEFAQGKKVRTELSSDTAILAETLTVAATRLQEARAGHPSGNAGGGGVRRHGDDDESLRNRNRTKLEKSKRHVAIESDPGRYRKVQTTLKICDMTLTRPWMICVRRFQEAALSIGAFSRTATLKH